MDLSDEDELLSLDSDSASDEEYFVDSKRKKKGHSQSDYDIDTSASPPRVEQQPSSFINQHSQRVELGEEDAAYSSNDLLVIHSSDNEVEEIPAISANSFNTAAKSNDLPVIHSSDDEVEEISAISANSFNTAAKSNDLPVIHSSDDEVEEIPGTSASSFNTAAKSNDVPRSSSVYGDGDSDEEAISTVSSSLHRSIHASSNNPRNQPNQREDEIEIILSDEEDETPIGQDNGTTSIRNSQPGTSGTGTRDTSNSSANGYTLRRKRKINYGELENGPEDVDDKVPETKTAQKKDILDIFSLSSAKISKYTQNPDLIDDIFTKCKIIFMHGTDSTRIKLVSKFFEKCGHLFDRLLIQVRYDTENYSFLHNVFKNCSALSRLEYRYQNQDDAFYLLKLLKKLTTGDNLLSLTSLKLVGVSGSETLRDKHIAMLAEINARFTSLVLGDALYEDVKSSTVEALLEKHKLCLETLIINGGYRGEGDKEKIVIALPKMEALKSLCICPKYAFMSEIKNPYSKKARIVTLEVHEQDNPFKIAIKFTCDLPKLRHVVLGNIIDIEDLVFSSVRKLIEFRCGSYWNLSITFPSEGSRKARMESTVTELQFPDALKDPTFIVKVAKHFPNAKKVWLNLPSVPVLRAFFKAFENSKVEELYLKTQYDFEKIMESCLLPNMRDVLEKSQETEAIVQTLREYKHFDEYMRYYNVELPVELEDLMEGHSAGIGALKNLKILHLEHIPRKLLIPVVDDERKWYDHNCKFMSTTFGHERYPLNLKCHQEILKLNLSEYIWKNIEIGEKYVEDLHEAGFVDIPDVEYMCEVNAVSGYSYDDYEEDEEIFFPIHKSERKGTHVKIMPSMLLPSFKAKPEGM